MPRILCGAPHEHLPPGGAVVAQTHLFVMSRRFTEPQGGHIEGFETVLLEPHGGDLGGFILVRGTREQLDAIRNDDDLRRRIARGDLLVERLGVIRATLADGLEQLMSEYQDLLDK
jgi:hypothetical protein